MIHIGDCLEVLKDIADNSIDLVVTSPPYDNLRTYNGYSFDFEGIARELTRTLKAGGIIVWVVNDATINGSETGTSFKQALYFISLGLNLHDTMIWVKPDIRPLTHNRYEQGFEYMFVLSKGKPRIFNGIKDNPNVCAGRKITGTWRDVDGTTKTLNGANRKIVADKGLRFNVWTISTNKGKKAYDHPATFPLRLALDHIQSWSNPGDTVLDPFLGSGTTGVAALQLKRSFIGIEISKEYAEIAKARISAAS